MRSLFINTLVEMAKTDERIWLITPDLGYCVLEPFKDLFPDRFLNVGIAEQNAIGIASGLALQGKIPYVYSIIPFAASRPYESIKINCAYMNTNVRIVGVGAGFAYGPAGATHHSLDDIAIMRTLPNMSIIAPGSLNETDSLLRYSSAHQGPMYIRLSKRGEPSYNYITEFGKLSNVFDGCDFAIIATSSVLESAYQITEELRKEGKNPILLSAHTLKPFDDKKILEIISTKMPIITIEEHNIIGGLASIVSEVIAKSGKGVSFLPIGVPDQFSHYVGSQNYIKAKFGLDNKNLKLKINNFLEKMKLKG